MSDQEAEETFEGEEGAEEAENVGEEGEGKGEEEEEEVHPVFTKILLQTCILVSDSQLQFECSRPFLGLARNVLLF